MLNYSKTNIRARKRIKQNSEKQSIENILSELSAFHNNELLDTNRLIRNGDVTGKEMKEIINDNIDYLKDIIKRNKL